MDFYNVIQQRYSYRKYKSDPIPTDALERISHAVSLAPTAYNKQPFIIKVVFNADLRSSISDAYPRDWIQTAPAIAVMIVNDDEAWTRDDGLISTDIDSGIVLEHFVLAAQAEGLGTCWVCAFDQQAMNRAMSVTAPSRVIAITPLGYPQHIKDESKRPERKPIKDIFQIID